MLSATLLRANGETCKCFSMYDAGAGQCLGKIAVEFHLRPLTFQTYGQEPPGRPVRICSVSRKDWIVSAVRLPEKGDGILVRLFSLAKWST